MNQPIPIPLQVGVAAGVAVLILVLLVLLRRALTGRGAGLPYLPVDSLLTPAELVFYRVLLPAVTGLPVVVFVKVRLVDLLQIPRGTDGHQSFRARVQSKHIDFVVCDATTLRPVLAVELDDASHRRADRVARDAFVDSVMETIGLPILHVPCAARYHPAEVRDAILSRMHPVAGGGRR